ncbi:hypothetical protein V8F20_001814 [Naviculisporaceae sp. PSN 640]
MHFSKLITGTTVLLTGLAAPTLAGLISTPGSDLFEKRQQCEIKACETIEDCSRHCTEGCNLDTKRCETTWMPPPCARGCEIITREESEGSA